MNAASDLLQSLRDFGWPIFAFAIFAPISTFVLPSNRSREEQVERLLFVGIIIAVIEALFFLGTESGDALQVARLHPEWGVYVLLLSLAGYGAVACWWLRRVRENRTAISISESPDMERPSRQVGRGSYVAAVGIWAMGAVVAVVWLYKISQSLR